MSIFFIMGCSFSSPILSKHEEKRTVLLQKSPIRIYISGQMDDLDAKNINSIIRELDKCTYHKYNFDKGFTTGTGIDLSHSHSSSYNSETKFKR
jgi:hypothetical protein